MVLPPQKQNQLAILQELPFFLNEKQARRNPFANRGAGGFPVVCQAHLTVGGYLGLRLVEFLWWESEKTYPSDTDDVIAHRKSCQTNRISWSMGFFFCVSFGKAWHHWTFSKSAHIPNGKSKFEMKLWKRRYPTLEIIIWNFFFELRKLSNEYTPPKNWRVGTPNYGLGKRVTPFKYGHLWCLLYVFRFPWGVVGFFQVWFEKTVWMGKGEDLLEKIESHSSHGSCLSTWLGIVRNLYLKVKIDGADTKR